MYNGRCYVLELRRAEFASFEMEHTCKSQPPQGCVSTDCWNSVLYTCTSYYRLHVKHGLSWDGTPSASYLPTVVAQGNLMSS